jgi:hypothetical protein
MGCEHMNLYAFYYKMGCEHMNLYVVYDCRHCNEEYENKNLHAERHYNKPNYQRKNPPETHQGKALGHRLHGLRNPAMHRHNYQSRCMYLHGLH